MLPPGMTPPPRPPRRPLPECLEKLVRPKSFTELMLEQFARGVEELKTALEDLDRSRRDYELTDEEWRDMLTSYREHLRRERERPFNERMAKPARPPRLKWPTRLKRPSEGTSLEDYQAYIDRMRPYAEKVEGGFAIVLKMMQQNVELQLARQQRRRGKS